MMYSINLITAQKSDNDWFQDPDPKGRTWVTKINCTLSELLLQLPFKHSIIVYSDSFQKNIGFSGFIPTDF